MKTITIKMAFAALALAASGTAIAGRETFRNPPSECSQETHTCPICPTGEIGADCIKVNLDMGETTPWTGSMPCALKVFADDSSPSVFTPESLYAVCGYTFKRLGSDVLSDGSTPAEVVFSHPNGESVYFRFKDGESWGEPDPGVHIPMDERLMMVDAGGWATAHDPVYYDLYETDGTVRRFHASNLSGAYGKLVYVKKASGVVYKPEDMGIDIVYDSNGVRQFLTPSRLADVRCVADGYDVAVYPLQGVPAKDATMGLYSLPQTGTVKFLSVRTSNGGNRALVTLRSGDAESKTYRFDYAFRDWSMTKPDGVEHRRERNVEDSARARIVKSTLSPSGEMLSRDEMNFKWESWGFAMTNKVEGFGGVTRTTSWTYYTSGNGKGHLKSRLDQTGLLMRYTYDSVDRVLTETRSGPGMMTEVMTYDYTPVDASDPVLPVDTRPRTIIKTLNNIECERTYYVYSPLTNIVERVGTQGAPYGGTNVLRMVTAFYPIVANDLRSGFVASIRHEDGKFDVYDYSLVSNLWVETITHLHEQSPSPFPGKTTRDITVTNARGEEIEARTEAFIDGIWYTIARNRMTYNFDGKRITSENLAGQVTTTAWDCCHKVSETGPDGSTTTWDYDDEGRVIASSRLIPLDMANVTWLTTCYEYDDLGRQTATWQTNLAAHVGLPATRTAYDQLGRIIARVDQLGNTTTTSYSPDGRTVSVQNPNTAAVVYSRNADGDTLSVTGSAVTPEFHSYGILPDGTRWSKTVEGETASSPRFTKRYENLLGQTVREERSGFRGAVLVSVNTYDSYGRLVSTSADYEPTTDYTYDTLGNRIAKTSRTGGSPVQWRRTSTESSFSLDDAIVWLTQTNIVSCSDSVIAPLVTSSARQLTGLSAALPARSRTYDVRGNVTEKETLVDSSFVTSRQTVPCATNKPFSVTRYGVSLMGVSVSVVTNTITYDPLGRQIAHTDGRGNTRHAEYNPSGQLSAAVDALGNRTAYAYDAFGNLASVTDPLGNAIVYEYDLRGRKTYEGGATYPVRYTYDVFGNKTTMMTYRDESLGPDSGDVTTWLYDGASGCMTNKVYADGKGPTYSYTPDGRLAQRVWARGIATDYSYDIWGGLTNTVYSDSTPTVSLAYDAMGRQTEARDAAGATAFLYDSFGSLTNETVVGVAGTNTIARFHDDFGRDAGYALNGIRQSTLAYDPATGRLATMEVLPEQSSNPTIKQFAWNYLAGSDLKSSLVYPNGLTASWQYDANSQLLQVCNAMPTNVISQYDYVYDAAGRRVSCAKSGSAFAAPDTCAYLYDARGELTNATASVDAAYRYAYRFDDIGNRETSSERGTNSVYTANSLNQYAAVDGFAPQFDDDGNQTLVKTATGIWQVQYNGENRPVLWRCLQLDNQTISSQAAISMSYDRMGRRVAKNDQRFVYDGYLQIADNCGNTYVWDCTEDVATRALVWNHSSSSAYYAHDGNKSVSALVASSDALTTYYDYSPFGAVSAQLGTLSSTNHWRFSSEFADDELNLMYYNYRHYAPMMGRWLARDPVMQTENMYLFLLNSPENYYDDLGLRDIGEKCFDEFNEKNDIEYGTVTNVPYILDFEGGPANDSLGRTYFEGSGLTAKVECKECCENGVRLFFLKINMHLKVSIQIVAKGIPVAKGGVERPRTKRGYKRTVEHEMFHRDNITAAYYDMHRAIDAERQKVSDYGFVDDESTCKREARRLSGLLFLGDSTRPPGEIGKKWNEAMKKEHDHSSDGWKEWGRKHGGKINDDEW